MFLSKVLPLNWGWAGIFKGGGGMFFGGGGGVHEFFLVEAVPFDRTHYDMM